MNLSLELKQKILTDCEYHSDKYIMELTFDEKHIYDEIKNWMDEIINNIYYTPDSKLMLVILKGYSHMRSLQSN